MYQLLHDKEAVALHKSSLDLTNINCWVERLSEIHHYVSPQNLEMIEFRKFNSSNILYLVISCQAVNLHC